MSIVEMMKEAAEESTGQRHVLKAMTPEDGDFQLTWDPSRDEEVKEARAAFKRLKRKGHAAYRVSADGKKAETMDEFDPNAKAMIMAPALVGG